MKCKKCNAELAAGTKIYDNCGQKVETDELQNSAKKMKNTKKVIIGILLLVVVAVGITAFLLLQNKNGYGSCEEVIAAFTESVGKDDEEELKSTFYNENDDFLKELINEYKDIEGIKDASSIDASKHLLERIREKINVDGEKTKLSYDVNKNDESEEEVKILRDKVSRITHVNLDDVEEINTYVVEIYKTDNSRSKYSNFMCIVKINGKYYCIPSYL